jgi:hypothetical protein
VPQASEPHGLKTTWFCLDLSSSLLVRRNTLRFSTSMPIPAWHPQHVLIEVGQTAVSSSPHSSKNGATEADLAALLENDRLRRLLPVISPFAETWNVGSV